ncbi:MAG: ABC transporter permease subunit [Armatimonadetes bacterium]|nr:ABC transporter permease subunit [Armatimonadota bacterium]MBS1728225.1 sugar ABC transporter permease [Armatimonadota bacterium]
MMRRREGRAGFMFALPWLFGLSAFMFYPLLMSLYLSFCDYSVLRPPVWVGTANYTELFHDEVFWITVKNTIFYASVSLPLSMVIGIALAMLLNTNVKGMAIYRTIFFIPSLVPMVSLAMLWLWLLNGDYGVINNALSVIGIKGPNWMSDVAWTKPALILLSVWGVGNAMLIYLASLQDVPTSLLEASELDGATPWQKTRNVTLPMISPVIQFNMIMGIIGSLQVFAVPFIMFPGGSPARSTYFYSEYLYDNAFLYSRMGYASAMGWVLFIVILILTLLALKLSNRHVHYGGV